MTTREAGRGSPGLKEAAWWPATTACMPVHSPPWDSGMGSSLGLSEKGPMDGRRHLIPLCLCLQVNVEVPGHHAQSQAAPAPSSPPGPQGEGFTNSYFPGRWLGGGASLCASAEIFATSYLLSLSFWCGTPVL